MGRTSDRVYDKRSRLVRVIAYPDPSTRTITKYDYDGTGNLVKVTTGLSSESDPQVSVDRYLYDSLSRKVQWTDPLGQSTSYTYDLAGNLTAMLDRNDITTRYAFDALGRMVSRRVAKDGELLYDTWVYGLTGARLEMNDGTGRSTYVYDELGRLVLERNPGGVEKRYSFDAMGNRASFELMWNGGNEIDLTYEYDPENRLAEVNNEGDRTTYEYDLAGRLSRTVNQTTGLTDALTRNDAGLPVSQLITWGPRLLYLFNHDYDLSGDMVKKVGWGEGLSPLDVGATYYAYDGMDRLTHVEYPDGRVVDYSFDDLGNRARMVEIVGSAGPGGSGLGGSAGEAAGESVRQTTYAYDVGSRLLTAETLGGGDSRTVLHFSYDANGNQVAKEELIYAGGSVVGGDSWRFSFDGLNRLDGVVTPEAERYRYTYTADGLRVGKRSLEQTLSYVWDGQDIVLETLGTGEHAVTVTGAHIISRTSSKRDATVAAVGAYYYTHTARGDVLSVLGALGPENERYEYDAYGTQTVWPVGPYRTPGPRDASELWANPFGFNGEQSDAESGSTYLRARFYDPTLGRFLSPDPAKEGTNWYVYCDSNPVRFIDTTGYWKKEVHYGLTFALGVGLGLSEQDAAKLAAADQSVDFWPGYGPYPWLGGQSYHFDTGIPGTDTRLVHVSDALESARLAMANGDRDKAIELLGQGLHALQDLYAHGDYMKDSGQLWVKHPEALDEPMENPLAFLQTLLATYGYMGCAVELVGTVAPEEPESGTEPEL